MVTYRFTITYTMDGGRHTHDLFVLARSGDAWLVVWRTLLPEQGDAR